MKLRITFAAVAALSLVVVAAAFAGSDGKAAKAARGSAANRTRATPSEVNAGEAAGKDTAS